MPRLLAPSAALGLALVLAACGQSETGAAGSAAPATSQATTAATPASASASAPGFASDAATLAVGETIYKQSCFACHDTGAAGAPKRGDKAAWAPRIAQGPGVLYQAALKGMNAMPPRGSSGGSDDEIIAAVDYIVAASR